MDTSGGTERKHRFFSGPALGLGCATALVVIVAALPRTTIAPLPPSTFPASVQMLVRFFAFINQPLCLLAFALALVVFVIRRKFEGVPSLAACFLIAGIVTRLFRGVVLH